MATFKKNVKIRTGYRAQLNLLIQKISDCLSDQSISEAKLLGLKNNLKSVIDQLTHIDEAVLDQLQPEKVENDVLESIQVLEPTHELLAELTLDWRS